MNNVFSVILGSRQKAYQYRQVSNISGTKYQHLKDFGTVLRLSLLEARCQVENEDVVGAAPTGDAPTTSERSIILLPTKVRLILDVLRLYSQFSTGEKNNTCVCTFS